MADDPTIDWHQASFFGLKVDANADVWNSGHVTEVVPLGDTPDAVVMATETGGVWVLVGGANPLPLSERWDLPDVKALTVGNSGPRHLFAGCAARYHNDPNRVQTAPLILETDLSAPAPLLSWLSVAPALPADAGWITRIVVLRALRKIVVACARELPGDRGGVFWSDIPPVRFNPADPPRGPYVWREAKIDGPGSPRGFWDIAGASPDRRQPLDHIERLEDARIIAGGYRGGGLYIGGWEAGDLVLRRPTVAFDDGADATALYYQSAGTTSVSSCAEIPNVAHAATTKSDGRLDVVMRSTDGGRSWTFCKALMANAASPFDLLVLRTGEQGANWNNVIAAHPLNPGMAALGWQNGTFLTLDAGGEWRPVDGGAHTHPDVHALLFLKERPDSIGFLYMGSDGGLARVDLDEWLGLTGNPAFRSDYNRMLPTLQCYSYLVRQFYGSLGASSGRFGLVATGLQDNGNVFCDLGPPDSWRPADGGDGGWNAFLADDTYAHNVKGEAVTTTTLFGGATIGGVVPISTPADPAGLRGPVAETVMEPRFPDPDGRLMLALASNGPDIFGLFTDGDGPPTYDFMRIGSLPAGESVTALGSHRGDRVFAGTSAGKMYSLDSATGILTAQTVQLPKPSPNTRMQGGGITRIAGFSDDRMFAVLVNAVETRLPAPGPALPLLSPLIATYVLAFDGSGWAASPSIGLPNQPIFGMVAIAAPQTRVEHGLLVSLDDAVWISRDDAGIWSSASKGLPARPHGADLRFAASGAGRGGTIFLSSYGRSLWSARI